MLTNRKDVDLVSCIFSSQENINPPNSIANRIKLIRFCFFGVYQFILSDHKLF